MIIITVRQDSGIPIIDYSTNMDPRELVVAFGRPGVRLPEKPTSGLQYSCSDQEFRLFVLTTAAPIDRQEE